MERPFNKEELEKLSELEIHFSTAVHAQYKRATSSKNDAMVAEIYKAATGKQLQVNASCGICSFNLYSTVGKKYFHDKEMVGKELEPTEENTTTNNNQATDKDVSTLSTKINTTDNEQNDANKNRIQQGRKSNTTRQTKKGQR